MSRPTFPPSSMQPQPSGYSNSQSRDTPGNICHASPAADHGAALLVYDATVNLASARGTRRVKLDGFFVGPRQTALQGGEIVTSIDCLSARTPGRPVRSHHTTARGRSPRPSACAAWLKRGRTRFAFGR